MRCIGCGACFETCSLDAPQHESVSLIALRKGIIRRRLAKRVLEGRTTSFQPYGILASRLPLLPEMLASGRSRSLPSALTHGRIWHCRRILGRPTPIWGDSDSGKKYALGEMPQPPPLKTTPDVARRRSAGNPLRWPAANSGSVRGRVEEEGCANLKRSFAVRGAEGVPDRWQFSRRGVVTPSRSGARQSGAGWSPSVCKWRPR
jgi:ferredoxin